MPQNGRASVWLHTLAGLRGAARERARAGRGPHAFALCKPQLGRSERMGAPGGLHVPGFREAPACEPAHLAREAKSLKALQALRVGELLITPH